KMCLAWAVPLDEVACRKLVGGVEPKLVDHADGNRRAAHACRYRAQTAPRRGDSRRSFPPPPAPRNGRSGRELVPGELVAEDLLGELAHRRLRHLVDEHDV